MGRFAALAALLPPVGCLKIVQLPPLWIDANANRYKQLARGELHYM